MFRRHLTAVLESMATLLCGTASSSWASGTPSFLRSTGIVSLFLLALPLFGQFSGKNVTPAGSTSAALSGTSSGKSTGGNGHAMLYDSTLDQTVDLNPLGYVSSIAKGTDGVEQVGYSHNSLYDQCTIWKGTAASAVTVTPAAYLASWCLGTDGGYEIGYAFKAFYIYSTEHAILWSGSPNTYVDLHSGGATYSRGRGIKGNEQVGETDLYADMDPDAGNISMYSQAVLWHGTAASMVILHPAGFTSSRALATNGTQEGGSGYGTTGTHRRPCKWATDGSEARHIRRTPTATRLPGPVPRPASSI